MNGADDEIVSAPIDDPLSQLGAVQRLSDLHAQDKLQPTFPRRPFFSHLGHIGFHPGPHAMRFIEVNIGVVGNRDTVKACSLCGRQLPFHGISGIQRMVGVYMAIKKAHRLSPYRSESECPGLQQCKRLLQRLAFADIGHA